MILLEYQNIKTLLQKAMQKTMLLVILVEKKLLESFMKMNCQKTTQKECRVEKVIKIKSDKLYVKRKC